MKAIANKVICKAVLSQPSDFNIDYVCNRIEQTGFAHIKNLFPESLLKSLYKEIKDLDENRQLQPAGIGRGNAHTVIKSVRRDKIHWIEGSTLAQCRLNEALEDIRVDINRRLMLGLFDIESHFAVYREGGFYKKHLDRFKGQKNRVLSMVIYLNPKWRKSDGGLLNVFTNENILSVMPQWGNVVIFLSESILHEVTVTKCSRYSIATWFRCNSDNPLEIL
ncbi:MAG: 2OG-Fe(II) oxygenase [Rickettsiales bacterium]|nr:2OG-Fe(II) oxygenase [Pseudomonadota bacterium]MDA0967597.1 2OG-Fe(II) oxygenase [Pseudomonadota bacterium]MDG4544374.1 2OG-Fe(II) oxygenase [Rickettsiales bacterium]MDG4546504.1 2OG-Fe(II) oxygenase [Rickettsiales bacterium]MDG4548660.1 2OG-Fe(II) oxygenase [Rickettsiales bacterium]